MRKHIFLVALIALSFVLAAGPAPAANIIYFGEDLGLGEATRLPSHANADAARAAFLAGLTGVGTEDFESFGNGTGTPLAISFPGAGTATLTGSGNVSSVPSGTNGVGRYPISGDNYWEAQSEFGMTFSAPVAAFGFYGVDIGDFSGQVTVTTSGGLAQVFNVGNTMGGSGGSVLFWGLISTTPGETFTGLSFGNTASGTDFFGFDDFTIGSAEQVVNQVPEPASLVLLGSGLLGLGRLARRKNRG